MMREFFEVPSDYYTKCAEPGRLVKIDYTSKTYDESNYVINKNALVYLPYDYDATDRTYPVFYLMHGGGGDCDEIFGGIEAKTDLKNILDNMIKNGVIEPLIVVAPSFYYEGTEEAHTSTKDARVLTQNFHHELRKDLLPVIEKQFRVKAGREHRAFGGYSMGAEATWNIFAKCLDEFKYFLPMSGDCWAVELQGGLRCPKETVNYLKSSVEGFAINDYNVFACVGDAGVAYQAVDTMIMEMKKHNECFRFSQDFSEGNMIYCVAKGGTHSYEYCYKYIYNALPLFFPCEVLSVYVKIEGITQVKGSNGTISMLQFSGEAGGDYFNGKVLSGGVDWQQTDTEGITKLSARYILEGVDYTRMPCRIAIENNGEADENGIIRTKPCIVTDSEALQFLEKSALQGSISEEDGVVVIHITK